MTELAQSKPSPILNYLDEGTPASLDAAGMPTATHTVSVVVPTYNEAANIEPLVSALRSVMAATPSYDWEIVFVDDSDDSTPSEVALAAARAGAPVRMVHREPDERTGGLSGAVIAGLRATSSDVVVVMDGDLQHPPDVVPTLVSALSEADVVVASRYLTDGSSGGLDGLVRHLVSQGSTTLAKAVFPRRLHNCTDPMTGFFALRREAVDVEALEPMGFKILLEVLARHDLRIVEVPFTFGERVAGRSKASLRQGATFVWQLLNLRLGRAGRFAVVGASGLVLNLVAMAVLMATGVDYVAASLLATEIAILSNFLLQERVVFADRAQAEGFWHRAWQCVLFNNVEAVLRLPLLVLAVQLVHLPELVAQAALILLAFALRFSFMSRLVYRAKPPTTADSDVTTAVTAEHGPGFMTPRIGTETP